MVIDNSGTIDVSQANHFKVTGLRPVKSQPQPSYVTVQFWVDSTSCGDGHSERDGGTTARICQADTFLPTTGARNQFTDRRVRTTCVQSVHQWSAAARDDIGPVARIYRATRTRHQSGRHERNCLQQLVRIPNPEPNLESILRRSGTSFRTTPTLPSSATKLIWSAKSRGYDCGSAKAFENAGSCG